MAFNISYSFLALDKFTAVAKKIDKSTVQLQARMRLLRKEFNSGNLSVDKFSSKLGGIGKSLTSFKALVAGGTVAYGIKRLINVGGDFEESMLDLSAITGATGKDLDMLGNKGKELGEKFGKSPAEIATAMKLIASAKPELLKNTKLLEKMTEETLLLSTASGMDMNTSATTLARSLNIFGESAAKANEYVNVLAAGSKLGASEIADTGEALLIAGGAAKSANLSFVQTNALLQTIAKGGFVAEKAGTGLQAILNRLPKVGLDIKKIGLEKSFEMINEAIEKTTGTTERAALIEQIFGQEHQKIGFALIQNRKLLSEYERTLRGTNVAQEQADIRMASFNFQMKILSSKLQTKLIAAFDRLRPKLIEFADSMGKFLDSIGEEQINALVEGLKVLFSILKGILSVMKAIVLVSSKIGKAWNFLTTPMLKPEGMKNNQSINTSQLIKGGTEKSQSDINVNINAPQGVIQSVSSKSKGNTNFNLGQNGRVAYGFA